jgi:hypothetical protein
MSEGAHETLSRIIEREAAKIDKLSLADRLAPLDGPLLDRVESLARAIKALRTPARVKTDEPEEKDGPVAPADVAELLKKA